MPISTIGTNSLANPLTLPNGTVLPTWTTATRPASPSAGQMGFNSTTGYPEWYSAASSQWVQFNTSIPYSIQYLVIAGGGGGATGGNAGGGGGAGGYRSSVTGESSGGGASAEAALTIYPQTVYTVTVGAGGAGGGSGVGGPGTGGGGIGDNGIIGQTGSWFNTSAGGNPFGPGAAQVINRKGVLAGDPDYYLIAPKRTRWFNNILRSREKATGNINNPNAKDPNPKNQPKNPPIDPNR